MLCCLAYLCRINVKPIIDIIIPAYNEEDSIAKVINDIDKALVREIVVVDNGSSDQTAKIAGQAGATVLSEYKKGYGSACLRGIEHISSKLVTPDIVVFIDADFSDHPQEMNQLITPIAEAEFDLVIGSRTLGKREKGSMAPQQIFGNWLATGMMRLFYQIHFTDLGPFRAIRWKKLLELNMQDQTYGWTIEMQLKAAKQKFKYAEVPVSYRKRIGMSKISGTMKGTILAGYKIISTILKHA
jgi:glycosyltransferase involved in cell wall biosynthesis